MSQEEIQKLVEIRMELLKDFQKRKDWKSNRNAIMREIEHMGGVYVVHFICSNIILL